jgi:hypothetical protein
MPHTKIIFGAHSDAILKPHRYPPGSSTWTRFAAAIPESAAAADSPTFPRRDKLFERWDLKGICRNENR